MTRIGLIYLTIIIISSLNIVNGAGCPDCVRTYTPYGPCETHYDASSPDENMNGMNDQFEDWLAQKFYPILMLENCGDECAQHDNIVIVKHKLDFLLV